METKKELGTAFEKGMINDVSVDKNTPRPYFTAFGGVKIRVSNMIFQ
jgi:hypothetical protein